MDKDTRKWVTDFGRLMVESVEIAGLTPEPIKIVRREGGEMHVLPNPYVVHGECDPLSGRIVLGYDGAE